MSDSYVVEFRVRFYESGPRPDLASIGVIFSEHGAEVSIVNVGRLTFDQWDAKRTEISSSLHSTWSEIYGDTDLAADLEYGRLAAETMMAVCAMHLLVPRSEVAREFASGTPQFDTLLQPRSVKDGLNNDLDVFGPLIAGPAEELVRFGQLQVLEVVVSSANRESARASIYFKPFNVPGVSDSALSADAAQLRDHLFRSILSLPKMAAP